MSLFGGLGGAPVIPPPAAAEADDDNFVKEEEVTVIDGWKASVSLDVVDVKSGEEDEAVLWSHRAKLLRFVSESSEWKERGLGDAKLLMAKSGRVRFLLRQEKTNVIRANHLVVEEPPLCQLVKNGESDKIWVWTAQDCSDEAPVVEQFALKFGSADAATEFKKAFEDAKARNTAAAGGPATLAPTPAPAAAAAAAAPASAAADPKVDALASNLQTNLSLDAGPVGKLKDLDNKYLALEKQYETELAELQSKFEKLWNPLLKERCGVLGVGTGKKGVATPAVEKFWLVALKNSDEFSDFIEEHDEDVLAALEDITFNWLDDKGKTGWKLHFHFAENDFFTNKVITKEYKTEQASEWNSTLEYTQITVTTPIEWKPNKNVTVELAPKKVKGGGKKKQKAKSKMVETARPSFFRTFFRDLGEGADLPTDCDKDDSEDEDDEEYDMMDMLIQDDVEIAEALRDHIIPHGVRYYTGEACEGDSDDEDDDEDDEDDDDEDDSDDDEDDDDDDDDSDEDEQPKKGGKPAEKIFGQKPGEEQKECKQQ